MKVKILVFLSILSGILLSAAWHEFFTGILIFIALFPLLLYEEILYAEHTKTTFSLFLYSYLAFIVWNGIAFWWAYRATLFAFLAPVILNSLLYAVVFTVYHYFKRKTGNIYGYFLLIIFWIAFEYLHHRWQLCFPWLSLGNALAKEIILIQWYEFTGILGGSLWILLINVLFFDLFKTTILRKYTIKFLPIKDTQLQNHSLQNYKKKKIVKKVILLISVIIVPILFSLYIYFVNHYFVIKKGKGIEIALIQPNINPYTEKFKLPVETQIQKILNLAENYISEETEIIVCPETAISSTINEKFFQKSNFITPFIDFVKKHPKVKVIIGAKTCKAISDSDTLLNHVIHLDETKNNVEVYNSALQIDSSGKIQIYHKSILVIGAETMPFKFMFELIKKINIGLEGGVEYYGVQNRPSIFESPDGNQKIAPVICWESVFGNYIREFVLQKSDLICMITNDGWWGESPAYMRHLRFAQLRAIETRRWIARCANTGVSCFINPDGKIISSIPYNIKHVLKANVYSSEKLTFYVRYGDYIGLICIILCVFIMIWIMIKNFKTQFAGTF